MKICTERYGGKIKAGRASIRSRLGLHRLVYVVVMMVCLLGTVQSWAHGALANRDTCILYVGPYSMYFSGYIPKQMGNKKFCDDLPVAGHAFIVMDFIERKLRSMPVEMEIVRNVDINGKPEKDGEVVLHTSAQHYPGGTIGWDHDFNKRGYYVGIVRVTDATGKKIVARFPFGVDTGGSWLPWIGLGVFLAVLFGGTMFWFKKTQGRTGNANGEGQAT